MPQGTGSSPDLAEAPPRAEAPATARKDRLQRWIGLSLIWLAIALLVALAGYEGVRLRRWTWNFTDHIRFWYDIRRGCFWGLEASGPEGYLNQYEKMQPEQRDWDLFLDYAPLRLAVMAWWGHATRAHDPSVVQNNPPYDAWQRSYEFNAPVLHFNLFMDVLGAVCAFFLTRLWVIRGKRWQRPNVNPGPLAGVWQGLLAAGVLWFNPAMLISSFAWPTWDAWIVPMYLLTVLLASLDLWFCAGLALAAGAMLKGQQFAVAPVFVFWTLIAGKPSALVRWLVGLMLGIALIASPWLVSYIPPAQLTAARATQQSYIDSGTGADQYPPDLFVLHRVLDAPALLWIDGTLAAVAGAAWVVSLMRRRHLKWFWHLLPALGVVVAASWPWLLARNRANLLIGLLLAAALATAAVALRPRRQPFVLAAALGAALLLCISVFHGSHAWWDCGITFGSNHYQNLQHGITDNLAGLLSERFGWANDISETAFTLPALAGHWPHWLVDNGWWPAASIDVTSRQLLNTIYLLVLPLGGIGIGLQARNRDRRMLVALVTPWLLFFFFPAQIEPRYLLFAAGTSAICFGESIGMGLLGLFLTAVQFIMTFEALLLCARGLHTPDDVNCLEAFGQTLADKWPSLFTSDSGFTLLHYLDHTHPDLAWGVFLTLCVFVYLSLRPRSRKDMESPASTLDK